MDPRRHRQFRLTFPGPTESRIEVLRTRLIASQIVSDLTASKAEVSSCEELRIQAIRLPSFSKAVIGVGVP